MRILATLALLLSTTTALAHDMKILSWNVFMLPKPIKMSWQKYRTNLITKELKGSDYDMMFFQEAFIGDFREALDKELSAEYPYKYHLKKRYPTALPVFSSGVYVMSKHPFKVIDHVYYKACAGFDCGAEKGSALVEVKLPSGKTVQIASTHLQSGEKYGRKRISQLQQVKKMLDQNQKPGVAQFFVGDLNIDSIEKEFPEGLDLLGMDHLDLQGPITGTNGLKNECYKTGGDGITFEWIDHMWVRGANAKASQMQVRVFDFEYNGKRCPLSDHQAIEAKLSLN